MRQWRLNQESEGEGRKGSNLCYSFPVFITESKLLRQDRSCLFTQGFMKTLSWSVGGGKCRELLVSVCCEAEGRFLLQLLTWGLVQK